MVPRPAARALELVGAAAIGTAVWTAWAWRRLPDLLELSPDRCPLCGGQRR